MAKCFLDLTADLPTALAGLCGVAATRLLLDPMGSMKLCPPCVPVPGDSP